MILETVETVRDDNPPRRWHLVRSRPLDHHVWASKQDFADEAEAITAFKHGLMKWEE